MTRSTKLFTVVIAILAASSIHAQPSAFEVASIKSSANDEPMIVVQPGLRNGTMLAQKVTLRMLLAVAYGMTEPRVIGPTWLDNTRFDVVAKSRKGVPDSELSVMLKALLKERFRLGAHLETRRMPVNCGPTVAITERDPFACPTRQAKLPGCVSPQLTLNAQVRVSPFLVT